MKKYLKYLSYVVRHRWFVMVECFKEGLYWQGLIHDWSKFLPSEFIPYARYFNSGITRSRDKTGWYKAGLSGDMEFDTAWHHHFRFNKHHWQFYVIPVCPLIMDVGPADAVFAEVNTLPIPDKYLREMICDWKGAGRAQGNPTPTQEWYLANRNKMVLNPDTIKRLEELLGVCPDKTSQQTKTL